MSGGLSGLGGLETLGLITSAIGKIGGAFAEMQAREAVAKSELRKAAYVGEKKQKEVKYLIGKQKLLYAKAGVDPGTGSPLAMQAYAEREGAREEWMIREEGKAKAAAQRRAGRTAMFGGVTSFLTGMEKYYARQE